MSSVHMLLEVLAERPRSVSSSAEKTRRSGFCASQALWTVTLQVLSFYLLKMIIYIIIFYKENIHISICFIKFL